MRSSTTIADQVLIDGFLLSIQCDADGSALMEVSRDQQPVAYVRWWRKTPVLPWVAPVSPEQIEHLLRACWARAEAMATQLQPADDHAASTPEAPPPSGRSSA